MNKKLLFDAGINVDELMYTIMGNEEMFSSVLDKFLEDENYVKLKKSLEDDNYADALIYAHTLKGVAGTLSMSALNRDLQLMVDDLRQDRYDRLHETFEKITAEYYSICEAIGNGE